MTFEQSKPIRQIWLQERSKDAMSDAALPEMAHIRFELFWPHFFFYLWATLGQQYWIIMGNLAISLSL